MIDRNTTIPSFPGSFFSALLPLVLLAATACGGGQASTPRTRVAADLGCTAQGTSVQKIEDIAGEKSARWQVSGCGKSAIYVCTTPVRDCWREGEVRPDAEAPRPQ